MGMGTIALLGANSEMYGLSTTIWLFLQSLCLDIAYLSFQTIFFERFIACFKIKGNVGFFIITIDFVGYMGTLGLLLFKEFYASHIDWAEFYNLMSIYIGSVCCVFFIGSMIYIIYEKLKKKSTDQNNNDIKTKELKEEIKKENISSNIYLTRSAI